jgi:hypothetical protein
MSSKKCHVLFANIQMPDITFASTKYLCVGIKPYEYEMYSWRCCQVVLQVSLPR